MMTVMLVLAGYALGACVTFGVIVRTLRYWSDKKEQWNYDEVFEEPFAFLGTILWFFVLPLMVTFKIATRETKREREERLERERRAEMDRLDEELARYDKPAAEKGRLEWLKSRQKQLLDWQSNHTK